MNPTQIANGLTSALLGPSLGAGLVLIAWLVSLIRDGVPIREQVAHALAQLKPVAIPSLGATGLALLAGEPWQIALSAGVSAGLVAAGFRAPAK
jgi:hypothetical protein